MNNYNIPLVSLFLLDHLLISSINSTELAKYNSISSVKGFENAKKFLREVNASIDFWISLNVFIDQRAAQKSYINRWDQEILKICCEKINLDKSTINQLLSIYFSTTRGKKLNNLAYSAIKQKFKKDISFQDTYLLLDNKYKLQNFYSGKTERIWEDFNSRCISKRYLQKKMRNLIIDVLYNQAESKTELDMVIGIFNKFCIQSYPKMENIAKRALIL